MHVHRTHSGGQFLEGYDKTCLIIHDWRSNLYSNLTVSIIDSMKATCTTKKFNKITKR